MILVCVCEEKSIRSFSVFVSLRVVSDSFLYVFHCQRKILNSDKGNVFSVFSVFLSDVNNIFIFVCWHAVSPLELWHYLQCNVVHDSLWECTQGFLCSWFQHLTVQHEIPNTNKPITGFSTTELCVCSFQIHHTKLLSFTHWTYSQCLITLSEFCVWI